MRRDRPRDFLGRQPWAAQITAARMDRTPTGALTEATASATAAGESATRASLHSPTMGQRWYPCVASIESIRPTHDRRPLLLAPDQAELRGLREHLQPGPRVQLAAQVPNV